MSTYRFGDFELDMDAVQLRRSGQSVRIERRPLDLLILLVSRHGRLVPREEIIAALWPSRVIIDFDSGLNTLVRKARAALGDSSETPQFIETVPGRGYRFIAPVMPVEPAAAEAEAALVAPAAAPPAASASESGTAPDDTRVDRPPENSPAPLPRRAPARRTAAVAAAALLLLAVMAAALWLPITREPPDIRIAVLPFENLTGDTDLGYLATGLAEETSISLSQIDLPNLRVIGAISARAVADPALSVSDIGRRLGVDYVVRSALNRERSRIRVTSRLLRAADGEQVWSAALDRELTNVLGLQRELSVAIAEQIRQQLSPEVAAAIDRRQTQNPAAYELYLKGRHVWNQLSQASVRDALGYFEQAAAMDPDYGLAWAGIAHTLITAPITVGSSREATRVRAREALDNALRLGPELAETQYALGYYRYFVEWDFAGAETAARHAVALDSNNVIAWMFLGLVLTQVDKHAEALAAMRRARELDPLFALAFANSAYAAAEAGELQLALELGRQAVVVGPDVWAGYYQLGNVHLALGDYEAALETFTNAEKVSGGSSLEEYRAFALARLGREAEARVILEDMKKRVNDQSPSPRAFAVVYAGLGESDLALEAIEQALPGRDSGLLRLATSPLFQSLHADPRFGLLLQRAGHAPSPQAREPLL